MKKFLKITAVILISLLVFFVGTFKYRQYKANQISIPKNTTSLIKIGVDEIYKSLAANMIANPQFYFKYNLRKDTKSNFDAFEHGLKIPASIYFYNITNTPITTFFSRFEIKEIKEFENFLKNTLHLQIFKKIEGVNLAKSKFGNFVIAYNSNSAAIALAIQTENYEPILLNLLKQKDFVKINNSRFKELLKRKEHLAFNNKENNGWINFNNGIINFSNDFLTKDIILLRSVKHRKLSENTIMSFWLSGNFKPLRNKVYKYKNFSLNRDSLLKYYNGNVDFEWTNSIQQTDSIITYEYNDNFEKVEKVSLQNRNIPLFFANIETKTNGFKNYLAKQDLVNLDSNTINRNVFPLYKVFVNDNIEYLNFSTQKAKAINANKVSSEDFFYLNVDFIKLTKQLEMPVITNYFKVLKRFEIKGKTTNKGKANLKGKLQLKDENINSLYQILKSF